VILRRVKIGDLCLGEVGSGQVKRVRLGGSKTAQSTEFGVKFSLREIGRMFPIEIRIFKL